MEALIRKLLSELGEDPERDGLRQTATRVSKSLRFLTKGYQEDPAKIINGAVYASHSQEMVLVKDIDFFSLCEHHLLPFYGRCHLAYIPDKKIIGLSRMARVVEVFARRLQLQERLTQQIAETIQTHLQPLGVAVVMEAHHLCMMMRGVEKQRSRAVTSAMLGSFQTNQASRQEFLSLTQTTLANL